MNLSVIIFRFLFICFLSYLLTISQLIIGQEFRIKKCLNCNDNTISGSMSLPTNGFTYDVNFSTLSQNPNFVNSDFGPRNVETYYHIGIDINPQTGDSDCGDAIFPIETGCVEELYVGQSYKYIVISGEEN